MNVINTNILKSMKKREYITYLKNALGLFHFLEDKGMRLIGGNSSRKKENGLYELARLLDYEGNIVNTYYVRKGIIEFDFYDSQLKCYNVADFFGSVFDDDILFCLLIASKTQKTPFVYDEILKNNKDIKEESLRRVLDEGVDTLSLFEKKGLEQYHFILGAGINYNLGPDSWQQLIGEMRKSILSLTTLTSAELDDFQNRICNTTYVIPQILKDINEKEYFTVLDRSIYDHFSRSKISVKMDPLFEETTIYQVARILASNVKKNAALTFNYDEILEMVLEDNFSVYASSIFKGNAASKNNPKIYHSHGFWPYSSAKNKSHENSIVLSSIEYMESYQTTRDYSAKTLDSFIDKTCILIGNSLSDYEEQKIFKGHYSRNMAQYSFLFMRETNAWRKKYYLTYYLKMGVIPVFFDDFDKMVSYLKTL